MRILALIPARGGSKRLPGKNIRVLGGKPLIVWSIDVASEIIDICDTLISTDDPRIAEVARNAGALVPWLRPDEISTDTASSVEVCLHGLDWYESKKGKVDGLLLLQPTSPFREQETVSRGIELFRNSGGRSVVGLSPAKSHPSWCFKIEGDSIQPVMEGGGLHQRSQDLLPVFVVNGSFYLSNPGTLRKQKSFLGADTLPLIIESDLESIDIDTEWDWQIAESIISNGDVLRIPENNAPTY